MKFILKLWGEHMAYFPLFVDLEGKVCMIIGDGPVAERKAGVLRKYGARVLVYGEGQWDFAHLKDAYLVIAATNQREINEQIAQYCREQQIMVNVADSKEESAFLFPSVVKEGGISIGITTGGASPVIASDLRKRIEAAIPEGIGDIAQYMGEVRKQIVAMPVSKEIKKKIFNNIYESAKRRKGRLKKEEYHSILKQSLGEENDNISTR